ncbi:MAG: AEC family transporter, partial [Alphaproteobacteria bacterium]|nr:AEC family transporter [Alphaproteobacteria bacterium]
MERNMASGSPPKWGWRHVTLACFGTSSSVDAAWDLRLTAPPMNAVLNIVLPFFALVFSGYGAAKAGLLDESLAKALNAFVFWFALPTMLVLALARAPLRESFDGGFLGAYYGGSALIYALAMGGAWVLFRRRFGALALQGMGATFGNVGYIGLPLVLELFGPSAALPAALIVFFDNLFCNGTTILLLEAEKGAQGSIRTVVVKVLKGLLINPLMIGITVGSLIALSGVALPGPVEAFGRMLGGAAGPCALFALGATLAGRTVTDGAGEIVFMSALKVYFHPLLVWLLATHVFRIDDRLVAI